MHTDTLPSGRQKLAALVRAAGDIITTDDAVAVLSVKRGEASRLLSRWAHQGWLRRVGRGKYAPVTLDALQSEHVLEDPWVLVPALYAPAYVGGWSAAEHWGLTEQIFRDILVMTAKPVRKSREEKHGAQFITCHIDEKKIFGTHSVWRGSSKIMVSDVRRTVVDMFSNPAVGGGIQHIADCFSAYLHHPDRNDGLLIDYAKRLGNGAVFKRLGFLAERHSSAASGIADACRGRLTQGNAKLDPAIDCTRLVSKWRLWIPQLYAERRT